MSISPAAIRAAANKPWPTVPVTVHLETLAGDGDAYPANAAPLGRTAGGKDILRVSKTAFTGEENLDHGVVTFWVTPR
jgi:hypothetical protein